METSAFFLTQIFMNEILSSHNPAVVLYRSKHCIVGTPFTPDQNIPFSALQTGSCVVSLDIIGSFLSLREQSSGSDAADQELRMSLLSHLIAEKKKHRF